MQFANLLARDGLTKDVRSLIGVAVSTWNADWQSTTAWIAAAHQQQQARADIEETLLQCVLFCGFPRVITAFECLNDTWPIDQPPSGGSLPMSEQTAAGSDLFRTIYGKNDTQVRAMLKSFHGELHDFVLEAAYGRILSRPHLTAKVRELIAVAVLAAQGQKRQFAGHVRGAQQLGATRAEIREALITAFGIPNNQDEGEVATWLSLIR